ncbi:MAG TPA: carboxylating nicotinate-nucleotide diphosphorylase, partial [Spirochaetia bacterium]|nr:carboxylating nicotinate-nucleotide diphosphorylase [Spirochaetia bacterium]
GELLEPGVTVATIRGFARSVLTAERVALNFLSFLSGIATATRLFVETAGKHGTARILDTRKTLPGYRELSKYAVRMGGGTNHRRGLYDMVLIKDNHIDQAGSITVAVERVRAKWGYRFRVEVECRSLEEVREAIGTGVDVIMLDNMDKAMIQEAVALKKSKIKFEVSGNMDLDSVEALSSTGIDFISIGRITHSVRSFDFSMKTRRTG